MAFDFPASNCRRLSFGLEAEPFKKVLFR